MWLVYVFCPCWARDIPRRKSVPEMYKRVHEARLAQIWDSCSDVKLAQMWVCTDVRFAPMWDLHRCEACTDVRLAPRWDLHRCETCTKMRLAQMWGLHKDETLAQMWGTFCKIYMCKRDPSCPILPQNITYLWITNSTNSNNHHEKDKSPKGVLYYRDSDIRNMEIILRNLFV